MIVPEMDWRQNTALIDSAYPVRPCVLARGLDYCAQSDGYICERITWRLVVYEDIRQKAGGSIPEDDYQFFIRPSENKRRLEALKKQMNGKL
jgi:hypothetical protein